MLPFAQKITFLVFAGITGGFGAWGFYRLYRRIARGRADADLRWNRLGARVWYALTTTLLQTRTFKKRPWVSFFHSFIFYGFTFYILVNFVDALEGYFPVTISSGSWWGALYNLWSRWWCGDSFCRAGGISTSMNGRCCMRMCGGSTLRAIR
jgi:hypothetical protein